MITKAIIQSIDYSKNICRVRIPLFENASRNVNMIEADAQFSIIPGVYNSYKVGDIVFIGFEENKMEAPIILGKLFVSASAEASSYRGNLSGNSLAITESAQLPYSTIFNYSQIVQNESLYKDLNTPKKLADSIIELRQSQTQKYQTVIKVAIEGIIYELYLKTTNDFTYSPESSVLPLYKLCTVLKSSQAAGSFIPLDLALDADSQSYSSALRVEEFNQDNLKFKVLINGISYEVIKENIIKIHSQAIYY